MLQRPPSQHQAAAHRPDVQAHVAPNCNRIIVQELNDKFQITSTPSLVHCQKKCNMKIMIQPPQTPPSSLATRHVVFPSIFDYFPTAVLTARPSPLSDTTLTAFCRKSYLAGRLCPKLCTPCTLSNSDESQLTVGATSYKLLCMATGLHEEATRLHVEGHVQKTAFIYYTMLLSIVQGSRFKSRKSRRFLHSQQCTTTCDRWRRHV